MKKSLFILLVPVLIFTACKNEKKETPNQMMEEATNLPSMHVAGSNFSVDVPEGWTTKDTTMNGVSIYFLIGPVTASGGNTTVNIIHEGMQNLSPEQYKEANIAAMKPRMGGFKLKEEGEIKAGDLEGKWFDYNMNMGQGDLDAINYTFSKDKVAYVITGVTPAGGMAKYKPTFDAVARSFRLKSE